MAGTSFEPFQFSGVDEVVFQESLAHSPVVGLLLQGAVRLKHAL